MSGFFAEKMKEGRIKQATGHETGNVIPPWTHAHARTDTLLLHKELIMKCVDPLESKYAPACFPACFFENATRAACQQLTGVNPAA